MISWRYIKFLFFYWIRFLNLGLSFLTKNPSLEAVRFLPDTWCFFSSLGYVTEYAPHFMSFVKMTPSPYAPSIWSAMEGVFETEPISFLKEKFENFSPNPSAPYLFETLQKKEGGECLIRLWKIENNKCLIWFQNIEKSERTLSLQESLIPPYRRKLSEILAEFPLILWHHTEKQCMDYCNRTYGEMLSQDVETVLFKKENLLPSHQVSNLFQKVKKTGKLQKLRLSKTIEGERYVFDLWEKKDPEGGSWGCSIDVSEYEKSKEIIKKELKALEKIFDYLPISIGIFTKDQKLIYFNQALRDLFLLDGTWLLQNPTFEEIFDELRNKRLLPEVLNFGAYKKKFMDLFKGEAYLREETLHLPDERSVRFTIEPYNSGGLIMIFEDITDRLVLERKNNTMIAVQNALVNHLQQGVWIFGVDHCLTLANNLCAQLWGIDDASYKGQHLTQLLNQTQDLFECRKSWSLFKTDILGGVAHRALKEGTIYRKDGIFLKFSYIPLPNGEHLITYHDMTDSVKFQEILKESTCLLETTGFIQQRLLESMTLGFNEWTEHFEKFLTTLEKKVTTLSDFQKESIIDLVSVSENLKKNLYNISGVTAHPGFKENMFFKILIESSLFLFQDLIKEKNIQIFKNIQETPPAFIPDKQLVPYFFYSLMGYALQGCSAGEHMHISAGLFQDSVRLSLACRLEKRQENGKIEPIPSQNKELSFTLLQKLAVYCGGRIKIITSHKGHLRLLCDFPLTRDASSANRTESTLDNLGQTACG